jgi:hypothetical protein
MVAMVSIGFDAVASLSGLRFAFGWAACLPTKEHVLLVGVQHVSGMWVLRGMGSLRYGSQD